MYINNFFFHYICKHVKTWRQGA